MYVTKNSLRKLLMRESVGGDMEKTGRRETAGRREKGKSDEVLTF